jgi:hypothetical protein
VSCVVRVRVRVRSFSTAAGRDEEQGRVSRGEPSTPISFPTEANACLTGMAGFELPEGLAFGSRYGGDSEARRVVEAMNAYRENEVRHPAQSHFRVCALVVYFEPHEPEKGHYVIGECQVQVGACPVHKVVLKSVSQATITSHASSEGPSVRNGPRLSRFWGIPGEGSIGFSSSRITLLLPCRQGSGAGER